MATRSSHGWASWLSRGPGPLLTITVSSLVWNPGTSLPLVADYEGPRVARGCLAVKACGCPRGPLSECIFLISMEVKLYSLQLSALWFSFSAAEVLFLDPFSGDHFGCSVSRRSEPWIQKSPSTHLSCPSYRKRQFFPSLSCMPSCGAGLTSDLALSGLLSPHLSPSPDQDGLSQALAHPSVRMWMCLLSHV